MEQLREPVLMSLLSEFQTAALTDKSIVPFCKLMAQVLDDLDARIEDRRVSDPLVPRLKAREDSFVKRMGQCNGYGDVLNCIRDMAGAVDKLAEWMDGHKAEEPEKRRPGRPRKDAA